MKSKKMIDALISETKKSIEQAPDDKTEKKFRGLLQHYNYVRSIIVTYSDKPKYVLKERDRLVELKRSLLSRIPPEWTGDILKDYKKEVGIPDMDKKIKGLNFLLSV